MASQPPPDDGKMPIVEPLPEITVEAWPSGGWVVRMAGHPVPISRHDTEEEALHRAGSYRQGFNNELLRSARDVAVGSRARAT